MSTITDLHAREILDSRGNPTVEVDLRLGDGSRGRAAVPSGASTGSREAVELRDGGARYGGKGVRRAVGHVNGAIRDRVRGLDAIQAEVDEALLLLDGTADKGRLGANAILGVSLALARALAASRDEPLYRSLRQSFDRSFGQHIEDATAYTLPTPMFNVLNGGVHADNRVDLQEFMVAPVGAPSFTEALRMGAEIYHVLKTILRARGYGTAVGDEGGFAPDLKANVEAIEVILAAIEQAGLRPGVDVVLALDPAASEFAVTDPSGYLFKKSDGSRRSAAEMVAFYEDWFRQYPIWMLEDGLAEDDWDGWKLLTQRLGRDLQLVGDDIFVTDPTIIQRAIDEHVANAVLIKLNQIGTVTETFTAIAKAQSAGYGTVVSHRSGETPDDFIADLAVAVGAGQIKTGAPCRGERLAKYNQLLRIEEELGSRARYAGAAPFRRPSSATR